MSTLSVKPVMHDRRALLYRAVATTVAMASVVAGPDEMDEAFALMKRKRLRANRGAA